jgi:glycosyltransferase involved in cell wall biosynthesis
MHDCFMQHILFVGHSPNLAGAEYSLLRLIQNIPNNIKVSVLAPSGGLFETEINKLNHTFFHLDFNYAFYLKKEGQGNLNNFLVKLAIQVDELKNKISKPDIIHSNTFFIWEGALLAAYWKIPHVWNLREIIMDSPTWNSLMHFDHQLEIMDLLTDKFICVSEALTQKLPESLSKKSVAINNGYEVESKGSRQEARKYFTREFNIPESAILCLTIGNFIKEKGYEWFLPICKNIIAQNDNVYFLWIGSHQHTHKELKKAIEENGLTKKIITPGHVDFFNQYIKGADIYCLPSQTEAFPTTLLEAQYNNIPIIARDCGGAKEIIDLGGGGVICPLHDSEKFEREILKVITQPNTYEAGEYVFTMDRMVKAYMEHYQNTFDSYSENVDRSKFHEVFTKNAAFLQHVEVDQNKLSLMTKIKIKIKLLLGIDPY